MTLTTVSAHLNDFTYGWTTPVLALIFSFLGCLAGLQATSRARLVGGWNRARWLLLAAGAIGGTGIWVMHFVAMLGFSVNGTDLRYDLRLTIASWLTAVLVVGIGLFIVGYGKPSFLKVIPAGLFAGVGVAAMHYTGMDGMRMNGVTTYDQRLVDLSIAIAIVAAIVALWFTVVIRRTFALFVAAAIMAVAVCSMHYTGMAAMRVNINPTGTPVTGTQPLVLLVPIFVFVVLVVVTLGYGMLNSPSERDAAELDKLADRIAGTGTRTPDSVPATSAFRLPADFDR
jgi:NO-binding membrane sensor protein with MHYT domain